MNVQVEVAHDDQGFPWRGIMIVPVDDQSVIGSVTEYGFDSQRWIFMQDQLGAIAFDLHPERVGQRFEEGTQSVSYYMIMDGCSLEEAVDTYVRGWLCS